MSQIKTIKDVNLKGKKVFVRVDFNVPFDNKAKSATTPASSLLCRP